MPSKGISIVGDPKMKGVLRLFFGSKTHDFASLDAAAEASTTVTVTGARVGDFVVGYSHSAPAPTNHASVFWDAQVTADNTVTVKLTNQHLDTAVDYASGTLAVLVAGQRDV